MNKADVLGTARFVLSACTAESRECRVHVTNRFGCGSFFQRSELLLLSCPRGLWLWQLLSKKRVATA
eukprot:1149480-Pelagomonas_calceolata.AAC.2